MPPPPPTSRSGPKAGLAEEEEEDDAWSLSIEDEKQTGAHIEQMTKELNAASLTSRPNLHERTRTAPAPASASARPPPTRKASASGLWSFLTRQPTASESPTQPGSSSSTQQQQPPQSHGRKGSQFDNSLSSPPLSSSSQHQSAAHSSPRRQQPQQTPSLQSPRSRASSTSSSNEPDASHRHSWIHIDTNADASSALRGKAVALLSSEEMAAAVRLNVPDILKDPATTIRRLRVSDQAVFYDAGPKAEPFDLSRAQEVERTPTASTSRLAPSAPLPTTVSSPAHTPMTAATAPPRRDSSEALNHSVERERRKREKLLDCLVKDTVDLTMLRKLAWSGLPDELRPIAWQLLLGYLPAPSARRIAVLARKRQEYADAVKSTFSRGLEGLNQSIWHQIHIDVPRTNPGVPLWQFEATQKALERVLYVWAIRHPASGYVQGINDLVTPFFQVFLSQYIDTEAELFDVAHLPEGALEAIEADSFWCLNKLLDGIQDNYVSGQPGIRVKVDRLRELCERVDAPLAQHLKEQHIEFMQFAFKWIHLLLLRVLPIDAVVRMWDTYMSEGSNAFADFHTYVCLAFLLRSTVRLQEMDFQAMMLFFQSPVEHDIWSPTETEVLLSEGFLWKSIFGANR